MTIATRPNYGEPIGRADTKGLVRLFEHFEKFLDDLIAQAASNTASVTTMEGITSSLPAMLLNKPVEVVTGADYECCGQEDVVVCTAGVTIKLPDSPRRHHEIHIQKQTAANVIIEGNGKTTMAPNTDILFNTGEGSSLHLRYVLEQDDWRIT